MKRIVAFFFILWMTLQVAWAQEGEASAAFDKKFDSLYMRDFRTVGCKDVEQPCVVKALAIPREADPSKSDCLRSVLPDVSYERDGRVALGIEFTMILVRNVMIKGKNTPKLYRELQSIVITETSGLQDICFANSLKVEDEELSIVLMPDLDLSRRIKGASGVGGAFMGVLGPSIVRTKSAVVSAGLIGLASRELSDSVINSFLGETSNGIVWISINSTEPKQPVMVGGRLVGQTKTPRFGMPKSSLKKLTVGQRAVRVLSKACSVFASGSDYEFNCKVTP